MGSNRLCASYVLLFPIYIYLSLSHSLTLSVSLSLSISLSLPPLYLSHSQSTHIHVNFIYASINDLSNFFFTLSHLSLFLSFFIYTFSFSHLKKLNLFFSVHQQQSVNKSFALFMQPTKLTFKKSAAVRTDTWHKSCRYNLS